MTQEPLIRATLRTQAEFYRAARRELLDMFDAMEARAKQAEATVARVREVVEFAQPCRECELRGTQGG